jgi:general secretion pathway protein J
MRSLQGQSAFTLVEVMLALALTSLLLGLLSSGVYLVSEDWNRETDVLDESLDEALAVLQLDRALHAAFPHSYTDLETLSRQIYFIGENDYLSFVSSVSPQRDPGLTAWELYSDGESGVLLRLAPAFSDNPDQRLSEAEPRLILPGYDLEFAYLVEGTNEDLVWVDEWDGALLLGLPQAIYVNLTPLRDFEDSKEPLEIVARVRANTHRSLQPNTGLQETLF